MNLEQQVCSFDLAKRLKELGVKQESTWYWWENTEKLGEAYLHVDERNLVGTQTTELRTNYKSIPCCYSAFTVAELGNLFPAKLKEKKKLCWLTSCKGDNYWACWYQDAADNKIGDTIRAPTEADARAKMLCYLLENRLI